jgi:group I intron endonuclease
MKQKYHFVYKTISKINKKYYIGAHTTDNLNDGYLGSGKTLKQSILKYGKENFIRIILEFFETREDAFEYEKLLVNESLVKDGNSYNMCTGGLGCSVKSEEFKIKVSKKLKGRVFSEEHRRKKSLAQIGPKNHRYGKKGLKVPILFGPDNGMYGKNHSDKTKKLISENRKKVKINITDELRYFYGSGARNKVWYNNGIECKRYYENQQPDGFKKGRLKIRKEMGIE